MDIIVILAFASAVLAAAVALATLWQGRRSPAHWALAAGMAALAAESICSALSADAAFSGDMVYWQNWSIVAASILPGTWLFFSLAFARGNYGEFLKKWRFVLLASFILPLGLAILFKGSLIASVHRGESVPWMFSVSVPAYVIFVLLLLGSVVILMNLERTFRASVGTMRWRIKYVIIGVGVLFAVRAYTSSHTLLFHAVSSSLESVNAVALLIACLLVSRSLFRSGIFQVSVYPSHSVLHGSLTILLSGIYLLIVGVLAKIVAAFGGDNAFTLETFLVLISLVLLAVLLFSEKVRLHTKRFVSRHFQRPLYDYRTVWRRFTEGTARRVEQAHFCDAVIKLLSDVFQALSVTIWVLDERKETLGFAASTAILDSKTSRLSLDPAEMGQVLAGLLSHPAPVDIDACRDVWAVLLRRLHPDEFRKGGNRICAPLVAGNELVGVITLGDRVGGLAYSLQDLDLLKSVTDQAAASLLNIRLSQRLAQARQMEAFQAMSTFFVHDLKNTASTLSLMLQNLPQHFNDPDFRQDALRGISKTVTHINDLIGRLSLLRQEITVRAAEADLNEIVADTLKGLDAATQISDSQAQLIQELKPLPKLKVDRAQIQSVLTNLVLNAREASKGDGRIKIQTTQRNGWAVLSVLDNGCGMNSDFIQHSLFRPFQTTKKKGIGIGMFQSRIIVEAHHGRIEVESEPGKGTTFRVLLPIQSLAAPKSDVGGSSASSSSSLAAPKLPSEGGPAAPK